MPNNRLVSNIEMESTTRHPLSSACEHSCWQTSHPGRATGAGAAAEAQHMAESQGECQGTAGTTGCLLANSGAGECLGVESFPIQFTDVSCCSYFFFVC